MRQSNKFLIVSLSACLSSAAIAQTCGEEKWRGSCTDDAPNFAGWYVGEGLGIGRANLKLGATNLLQSKNTLASNFHAGYNWALRDSDIILGVVGNYSSLRAINYSVNSAWSGFNSRPKIGENDYGLSLLVGFPVKQWMYHVKVGYGHTRSTGDYRTTNQDWLFGLGVQYKLNESWSVGADYDDTRGRAKKDDKAISTSRTVTLSLRYYLDADLEKRSQVTSLNEDIMYPSLPKDASTTVKETTLKTTPASDTAEAADDTATKTNAGDANNNLVTPAAQPKTMQIVLPSDDFFTGRTKYAIQPEGKKALDLLSEKLKDYSYEKIVISSYTDFRDSTFFKSAVGSISRNTRETPNEVITKTRAISVRDYLAKEAPSKLSMSSIEAVGKGSADAKATDLCAKSNPKLLNKCLAVDRRIVIEVVGLTDKKPSIASNSNTSN